MQRRQKRKDDDLEKSLFDHQPRKRFGQNFLHDRFIIQKIVKAIAPKASDNIVEIGPGLGALTTQILPLVHTLRAIELDKDLIPKLKAMCEPLGELIIYQADALSFDFTQLIQGADKLRVIGNLPYNISTPLLFHLLEQAVVIQDMHFMLQKEVVERIVAVPGTKDYGRLSVMMQYFCEVEKLFHVGAGAFTPAPQVESAIIYLYPRPPALAVKNLIIFNEIVKQAFNQRRKTLRNSLKQMVSSYQWIQVDIDPQRRPEQLTVQDFVKIANILTVE